MNSPEHMPRELQRCSVNTTDCQISALTQRMKTRERGGQKKISIVPPDAAMSALQECGQRPDLRFGYSCRAVAQDQFARDFVAARKLKDTIVDRDPFIDTSPLGVTAHLVPTGMTPLSGGAGTSDDLFSQYAKVGGEFPLGVVKAPRRTDDDSEVQRLQWCQDL